MPDRGGRTETRNQQTMPEPLLVDPDWLGGQLGAPELIIVDARPSDRYGKGHIPGAISWDTFLKYHWADTSVPGIEVFIQVIEHTISQLGIGNASQVVFYGETSDFQSARGVWLLTWLGHDNTSLLDGGVEAWKAGGGAMEIEARTLPAAVFKAAPDPQQLATYLEILDRIGDRETFLVDTRTADEFSGENTRATRGGHIPGSVNLPYQQNLTEAGKFKSLDDLTDLYISLGIQPEQDVITVCHGGFRSAHTWLALKLIGHETVRSYLGSWQEWGDRIELPIEG